MHGPKNGTDTSRGDSSKDTVELGSSTVELELQAFNWKLSNPVSKLLFTTPVKSSPYMPLTTSLPAESLHTSQVGFLKSSCITQTKHLPFVADSGNGSQFNFCVKKSFRIEKKNKDIFISDAKLMPNKYHIAIAETSNPRCMMYTKDGFKKGQVQLLGKPDSIAVIEDHRIGVTLIGEKKVCVIDTDAWQCINTIDLNDSCKGLVYFENNLLANCINEGLMYINDSGKRVKENSNIKGEFYFHVDNQGNLFGAKEKIKRIHVCNLTNNKDINSL